MTRTHPRKKQIAAWRRALTVLLAGLMATPPGALLAQTVPAGTTNTTVLPSGSGNGVPVVNIAAPNAAGLSHNKFNAYNVPVQGQILNNSAAAVQTQLGGYILGNPNVAGARANVILNEVVQPNRSLLQGYTEVAGQAAQVIVANPYGITCTGCGFINTPRATLTTGIPTLDGGGNLTGFAVRQGDILINGAGLDAGGQNFFELVARSVVLQGQVNAKDLLVAAGSNDFNYLARTVTPAAPAGTAPAYAIDSSALGGMYVDRIRLIATEAGVGVRLLGNVGASVDDITLSSAGKIELQNQMSAQRDIAVAYTGGAMAGAVDIGGNAQVYAGQNLSVAGGAGGIMLGNALVGAGGTLGITGASLSDAGAVTDYRFSGGVLSVNVAGAAMLGGSVYDAGGALTFSAGSADLGTSVFTGRSAAAGISISSTAGNLAVNGAEITSPGSVVLNAAGTLTLGAGGYVASGADVTASFGGNFTNAGTLIANNNLQLSNTAAAATLVNDGYLSATGAMTLGTATLGSFTTGAASSTLAGTLTVNAPTVTNAGYLQADSANFVTGTNLTNSAGGTMVLGTASAQSNSLALNLLQNSGTLYSAGNLTLSTANLSNLAGGKLIVDGALSAGASGALTNAGSIDANDATLTAPTVNLTGGTIYATNDASLTASTALTMGGSLYAARDLTVSTASLTDTVTGGATRAAGRDFNLTSTGGIVLNSGQVYDAGNLLSITTPGLQVGTAGTSTALTSGSDIAITTNSLTLGSATTAGSLQAARDLRINPQGGNLLIRVGVAGAGPASSLQAGRDIAATFNHFQVHDNVLANGDITLLTRAGGPNRELVVTSGGWIEAAGNLALRGEAGGTRAQSLYINAGGTVAGGGLGLLTSSLYVDDGALLQGGQAGGTIDTTALTMAGTNSRIIANRWSSGAAPDSYVNIGSAFTNQGLLYAQGNMQVTVTGDIVNAANAAISTGVGGLDLRTSLLNPATPYQITNHGTLYGGFNLNVLVPEAGTLYNSPTGTIATGGGDALLGQNTMVGTYAGTFKNEGVIEFGGNAEIRAHNFYNNRPMSSVVRSNDGGLVRTYTASGDSGRYDYYLGQEGWDRKHSSIYPAAGAGDHNGRPNWKGLGANYYHVIDDAYHLYRDFQENWTESDSVSSVGAAPQILANGTLVIRTHTGQNIAGTISGGNLQIRSMYGLLSATFLNQSVDLYTYYMQSTGRRQYDCNFSSGDAACVGTAPAFISGERDVYATWTNGTPHANWGYNDGVAYQVGISAPTTYAATLAAPGGQFFSDIAGLSNIGSVSAATPTAATTTPSGTVSANPNNPTPGGVQQTAPGTTVIGGLSITLPTGPNGLFVVSTNPNAKYLIESNPLYASADNPFLGSDYLARKLGFNPDETLLRLGDANYEARLIREQLVAQTGAAILRTAYDAYDQQQMLMDNASLEAKELKLNYGAALTAAQVASLKHDIVWMVEQVVQGKKVLVPVVYLSSATRAGLSGATIVAENTVVTGDSFLNRGGKVSGASNLVIVTRKDLVNSSGELSGGNVQLQSLEGDIINRTETFRSGDAGNYTTSAGRSGGIVASGDLFMKADRDINVEGAAVAAGGNATVVAGRNVNVTALVLEARKTNIQNTSGMFNRDVSQTVETTQTAQGASITAGGNLTVGAKNDVNLTGAFVGSTGTTTLISEQGNVNIGTVQLTNTKQESTQHVGFFADSRAGSKPPAQDAAAQSGQAGAPAGQPGTQAPTVGGVAGRMGTADSSKTGGDKPQYDPNAHSAEAFTGLAITTTQASSTATGNLGSAVQGGGVNIVASKGNVNIQGSNVTSGAQGTLIDAAGNVNITAAYDTTGSTRKEESTRVGVAAEAGPGGAFAGVKVDGSSLDSQRSSSTASTSTLNSGGSVSIRAGGRLTNEGTSINAARDVNVIAAEVENKAAANTTTVNERSTNFNVSVMGGVTTGGIGDSISGMVQGSSQELNIAAPEAQLRAQASGSSTQTTGGTSTAVVTQIKSGGNTNFQVSGRMLDQGTSYSSAGSVNLEVGSYENRAAANTSTLTTNATSGGGTLTVGVDASRSANANIAVQGRNEQTTTSSSTAVTGGIQAGAGVNIRSRGDVTLEGTKVDAKQGVNIDAAGNLNVLQANNTSTTNSRTSEGSANLSASLCVDLSCASAGGGASARTTTLNENVREGVAGSISGANVNLRSGGNMTMQGTNIQSAGTTSLDAGGKVDFQALTTTISSASTADGGGANLSANVGASGKIASDGGGGGGVNFERGRGTTEGTVRQGGSITAGNLTIRSGGDTRLEGTQVQAGSAALNVGGNLTLESAQSTLKQDDSSVSGSVQASAGKSGDGGRNFGGAISLDVTKKNQDILSNQNATINTTGSTTLNVAGDATLAGANINAQGGVAGNIQGNLTVETRADHAKTEDTSFRGYVGVGNIQIAGKGDGGKSSMANKVDAAQDKIGNVANAAGGTGIFIDAKSDKTDNVTIGQRSGISGGAGGLGGLTVGGNANLVGAENTQGINVQGTTTSSAGPQTRTQTSSDSFALRGTVASAAGSDQGSGGTFSNVFQASGGQKPGVATDTPDPVTRPRSGAVSGDAARPTNLGGTTASTPDSPTRPRSGAVSGDGARPTIAPRGGDAPSTPSPRPQAAGAPDGSSAPGVIPPGRPRSESIGPNTRPANDGPTQFGAFPSTSNPTAPSQGTFTPGAPGRPRSESVGPDTRPASDGPYGAFQPLPGSKPPAPIAVTPPPSPVGATPAGSSAPGAIPPGRPRSESVGPDTRPASDGPTQYGAFQPIAGSTPPSPVGATPPGSSAPGVIPPGRPRSESVGPDTRPANEGPTQFGAFPSTSNPTAPSQGTLTPDLGAPGRDRSGSVGPANNPNAGPTQFGAFQPIPGSTPPAPIATGPTGLGDPTRNRSGSVGPADNPNQGPTPFGAFPSTSNPTAASQGTLTPDLGAPGRDRSGSVGPANNPNAGPTQFGSFQPIPGSTPPAPIATGPTGLGDPTRNRSGSVGPTDNPNQGPTPFGAFPSTANPTAPSQGTLTPDLGAPGRDRSGSVGPDSDPNSSPTEYGAFQPLPGSKPPAAPLTAPGRPRSDSTGPDTRPGSDGPYGAFAPIPQPQSPKPAASPLALTAPKPAAQPQAAPKPAANDGYGAFAPVPTGPQTQKPAAQPQAAPKPAANDGYGAFGPVPTGPETQKPAASPLALATPKPAAQPQGTQKPAAGDSYGAFAPVDGPATSKPAAQPQATPKPGANDSYGAFAPVDAAPASKPAAQPQGTQLAAIKPAAETPSTPKPAAAPAIAGPVQTRDELIRSLKRGTVRAGDPSEKGAGNDRRYYVNPENGLKLTTSASKYEAQDKKNGVKYFSPTERAAHELKVDPASGKLLGSDGKPYNSNNARPDGDIFVIDAKGRIYAAGDAEFNKVHHTSLTGNEPVALAGHLVVKDGQLLHFNNMSGHYRPDGEQLTQGVNLLKDKMKVDFRETRVLELSSQGLFDRKDGRKVNVPNVAGAIQQDVNRANGVGALPPGAAPGSGSGYGADGTVPNAPAPRAQKPAPRPAANDDGAFPAPGTAPKPAAKGSSSPKPATPASKSTAGGPLGGADSYGAKSPLPGSQAPASKGGPKPAANDGFGAFPAQGTGTPGAKGPQSKSGAASQKSGYGAFGDVSAAPKSAASGN